MAFTETNLPYTRGEYFSYYATDGGAGNVTMDEYLAYDKAIELKEIRVHFSVACALAKDFTVFLSSGQGSAYNLMLLSQAMNGIQDLIWILDQPMLFFQDDTIEFSLSLAAAGNYFGLNVIGWSVA